MSHYDKWFVEIRGSHTNEVIGKQLGDDACQTGVVCDDGRRHNLWACDYPFVAQLRKSRHHLRLDFSEWRQRGKGKISPWPPQPAGHRELQKA